MEVNITIIIKMIAQLAPWIIIGIAYGIMLGNLRSEFLDHIHRLEMGSLDRMAENLKMYGAVAERFRYCMMTDRFELVDVRKEENEKTEVNIKN